MNVKYLNIDLRDYTKKCQEDAKNLLSDEDIDKIEVEENNRIKADYIRGENASVRDMAELAREQGFSSKGQILQAFSIPFIESKNMLTGEPTYSTKNGSYNEVTLNGNSYVAQPELREIRFSDFAAFGFSEGFLESHYATLTDSPDFQIPDEYNNYMKFAGKYPDYETELGSSTGLSNDVFDL